MKYLMKVVISVACAFAPRNIRRRLRFWYKWRYSGISANWACEVLRRKRALELNRDTIRVLALGSSHGEYGFIPGNDSFNLCGASQDLYLSYECYKRCGELSRLRDVVLFYSVFSPGSEVERTTEKERCLYYKRFWGIPYRYNQDSDYKWKEKSLDAWLKSNENIGEADYRGLCSYNTFMPPGFNLRERVNSHLKNNSRGNNQTRYVALLAELAYKREHRVMIVVPPVRSDYLSLLPPFEDLFKELVEVVSKYDNLRLCSFWGDDMFDDSDFGDSDHLTLAGAQKLTLAIGSELRRM